MQSVSYYPIILIALVCSLVQCGGPSSESDTGSTEKAFRPPLNLKIPGSVLTTESVMNGLYGNYNHTRKISKTYFRYDAINGKGKELTQINMSILRKDMIKKNSVIYFLSATPADGPWTCRICRPLISIAEFRKIESQWKLFSYSNIGNYGGYGTAPEFKRVRLGKEIYGYSFAGGDIHTGIESAYEAFIAPVKKEYAVVFLETTFYSNFSMCKGAQMKCVKYSALVKIIPSKKDYFDIEYSRRGSDLSGTQVIDVTARLIYTYVGGSYKAIER